ncbi:MAG: type II toxin-antitoxin system VapC family toxin [Pyrinomonadaceae bacterium]
MAYLLDTCAISEMVAVCPNQNVLDWFEHQPETTMFLSIVTWGELQRGIYQLPTGKRRVQLETWLLDDLFPTFQGRIIDIDEKLITTWAKMLAGFKPRAIVRPSFDSLIEATALHRNLILVTRSERDFRDSDVSVFNPWDE